MSHHERQPRGSESRPITVNEKAPNASRESTATYEQERSSGSWTSAGEDWPDEVDDGIMGGYMEKDYDLPPFCSKSHRPCQHQPQRPLVDLVKNEWRTNPKYGQTLASEHGSQSRRMGPPDCGQIVTAPRLRRFLATFFLSWLFLWGNWNWWVRSRWAEHVLLNSSLNERMKSREGWYGSNVRPIFTDIIQLRTLDKTLVPGRDERIRLIVVGDVHGCKDECKQLLSIHSRSIRRCIDTLLKLSSRQ